MKRAQTNIDNGFLTRIEIEKFKKIAQQDYGIRLTNKQAFEQGAAIISLFEFLIKRRVGAE